MKKLIVTIAAVALAGFANATSVAWGITTALDTTEFSNGSQVYLLAGSAIADLTDWASTQSSFSIDSVKSQLGADLADMHDAPNVLTLTGGKASTTGNSVTTYGDGKTGAYKVYAVVIANDGKNIAVANSVKTITVGSGATPGFANYSASNFKTYAAGGAVPEPTSGLLLLLGVAGMALRRRRA